MSGKKRKEKVIWNEEEKMLVINQAVLEGLIDIGHIWIFLARAQLVVLPENRRRRIGGRHVVTPEIIELYKKARDQILKPTPEKVVEETPPPAPVVEMPTQQNIEPATVSVDRNAVIKSITNAEIIAIVAERLGTIFSSLGNIIRVAEALGGANTKSESPVVQTNRIAEEKPSEPPPVTPPVSAPEKKSGSGIEQILTRPKTVVVLFGFNDTQETEIRKKATSFDLELAFVNQPEGESVPRIPVCNWCIVNHSVSLSRRAKAALKQRPGNDRILQAGSSETALQKLNDINSRRK